MDELKKVHLEKAEAAFRVAHDMISEGAYDNASLVLGALCLLVKKWDEEANAIKALDRHAYGK